MSSLINTLVKFQDKNLIAQNIAIEASVLKRCELHKEVIFKSDKDICAAYLLGESLYGNGKFQDVYDTSDDMLGYIRSAVKNIELEECNICESLGK